MIEIPKILIGFKVHKDNKLIFDNLQEGHSWTRNFYTAMYSTMAGCGGGASNNYGAGYMTCKNTSAALKYSSTYLCKTMDGYAGQISSAGFGIVVGTGDTAFSVDDYVLATPVAQGTGSGQMSYQAMTRPVPTYDTKVWTTVHSRVLNNNSGGSITIKETGLVWSGYAFEASASTFYLVERSVLSPTVDVAAGAQLTVTYTISSSFAAID
jgi:hypothetical protein